MVWGIIADFAQLYQVCGNCNENSECVCECVVQCCSSLTIDYLHDFAVVKVCAVLSGILWFMTKHFWKRWLLPGDKLILVNNDDPALPQRLHKHQISWNPHPVSCNCQCWGLSTLSSVLRELDRIGICRFCSYRNCSGSFLISALRSYLKGRVKTPLGNVAFNLIN